MPKIGMNVHHRQKCRRLSEIDRDIEAVANIHNNFLQAQARKAVAAIETSRVRLLFPPLDGVAGGYYC
jgi:hypothetical protein